MTRHEIFVKELRTPVVTYIRKQKAELRRKAKKSQSSNSSFEIDDEIMKELEDKFDELFGTSDDD